MDYRKKYAHDSEKGSSLIGGFVSGAAGPGPTSASFEAAAAAPGAPMDSETSFRQRLVSETVSSPRNRFGLSRAFDTRGEDLVMAEASFVPVPPKQDARIAERDWGNHVSLNDLRLLCCV